MENWQPVKGYEGLYEVSDIGRVRSLKYGKERIMKTRKNTCGYLQVNLCKDGQKKMLLVHRIVAEAFIPNPQGLETINHKDEVKTNNIVSNLEWMSMKDNINYGTHNKRVSESLLKANINNQARSKKVQMFDKSTGELLTTFPSLAEAERVTGVRQCTICLCCLGKRKSSGGYVWKYL